MSAIPFPDWTNGLWGDIQQYMSDALTYVDNFVWAKNCYCLDTGNVQVASLSSNGATAASTWSFGSSPNWMYNSQLDHVTFVATNTGQNSGTWAVELQWLNASGGLISSAASSGQSFSTHTLTLTLTAPAGAVGVGYTRIFSGGSGGTVTVSQTANIYAIPNEGGWAPTQAPVAPSITTYVYPTGQTNDQNAARLVDIEQTLARIAFLLGAANPNLSDLGTQGAVTQGKVTAVQDAVDAVQATADALAISVDAVALQLTNGLPPTAAIVDAVSAGNTGNSSGALPANPSGVAIQVTSYPIWKGYEWDSPKQYPDLGEVTISGANGYQETRPILWINTYWAGLPALATGWQLSLAPGVEATITTYARA